MTELVRARKLDAHAVLAVLVEFLDHAAAAAHGVAEVGDALETGVEASFDMMRDRVATTHVHDNHGEKDEHLLPYEGAIDWDALLGALAAAPQALPIVLELKEQAGGKPALDQVRATFDKIEKSLESKRGRAVKS